MPADDIDVTFQKMVDDPNAPQPGDEGWEPGPPMWEDVEGTELSANQMYRVVVSANEDSDYFTGTWNPDDHWDCNPTFWVITKYVLWPYDAAIEGAYAHWYYEWPYVTYYLPEGTTPNLILSLYGEELDSQYFTKTWCDYDISPDTIYNEETHAQAILEAEPTTAGHYYVQYTGLDPYEDGGVLLFNIVSEDDVFYSSMEDATLLRGSSLSIDSWADASIGGEVQTTYEITGVEVVASEPDTEGDKVVSLEQYPGDAGCSWGCYGENYGTATLEVTYIDLFGVECSYTFDVEVVSDMYSVEVRTVSGSTRALPGGSIELVADGNHSTSDEVEGEEEPLSYEWALAEGAEEFATIEVDEDDSSRATVTFFGLPEGQDSIDETICVYVTMFGEDAEGDAVERATGEAQLTVVSSYIEIWPVSINGAMDVGDTQQITLELREYALDEEGEVGYIVFDDVLFVWSYDDYDLDIRDSAGNHVDEYNYDEETSRGSQVTFTIERYEDYEIEFRVDAYWTDEDETEFSEHRTYMLENRDFNARLESEEDEVFSDSMLDVEFVTDVDVDYDVNDLVFTVGIWNDEQEEWVQTFAEGCEYEVDGTVVTLDGAAIVETCGGPAEVRVVAKLMSGDNVAATADLFIRVAETSVEPRFEQDRDLMIDQGGAVNHWMDVWMVNSDFPDGDWGSYEVLDVTVISEQADEAGKNVLALHKDYEGGDETSDNYWWYYDALNYGTATLEVTYEDFAGNELTYTFDVHVVRDMYSTYIQVLSDFRRALPGQSIELKAVGSHFVDNALVEDEESYSFVWTLAEGSEQFATLQPDPNDSSRVTVLFREQGEDEDDIYEDVEVRVAMFRQDEQGAVVKLADNNAMLRIESVFDEVVVSGLDEEAELGAVMPVTIEVRHYSLDSESPDGYVVVNDVLCQWHYNYGDIEVRDEDGVIVDSGVQCDSSMSFNVKRVSPYDCEITVSLEWDDGGEYPREEEQTFFFGQLDYSASLECDDDVLYSDGTLDMQISYSEGFYPELLDVVITVGVWDNEMNMWAQTFTAGEEYTVDGDVITLNGAKLFDALGEEGYVDVRVDVLFEEAGLSDETRSILVREVREEYDLPRNRDMLPGDGGSVFHWCEVYAENAENPDGESYDFEVVNVEIVEQNPVEEGGIVIELNKEYYGDDDDYCWDYRAVNLGTATMKVTYVKLNGEQAEHYFNLKVTGDVYEVHLDTQDGSDSALPGGTITLIADARHITVEGESAMEDAVFEWDYDDDTECVQSFVTDGSKCYITFVESLDGEEFFDGSVRVTVTVFEQEDGESVERASDERWLHVMSRMTLLECDEIDSDMAVGDTKNVTAEVHVLSKGENGEQVDELVDNVLFRWYYDEVLDVVDSNGHHVGAMVGNNTYDDASIGSSVNFTVKRLTSDYANITLLATWTDANGDDCSAEKYFTLEYIEIDEPIEAAWTRLAGNNRYATMQQIVVEGWAPDHQSTTDYVILAKGDNFKDALAASGLAGFLDAPIVTVPSDPNAKNYKKYVDVTAVTMSILSPKKVFVMGGKTALKDQVVEDACYYLLDEGAITQDDIVRVFGNNARLTAARAMEVATELGYEWSDTAFVVTQDGEKAYKDALAAAPLSYALHMPIILAKDKSTIEAGVINKMKACGITKAYLVGGPNALGDSVVSTLENAGIQVLGEGEGPMYQGKPMRLLAGTSAIQTSMSVAEFGISNGMSASTVGVATTENFPDALAGAALCGKKYGVLVLAKNEKSASVTQFVPDKKGAIETGYVFGGTGVISEATFDALEAATAPSI